MRNVTDFGLLPKEHLVTELKKALGRITDLERACQLEHALAEEALCQTDKKYHTIFENAIIGIFKTTLDGKIISANPMMATLFCYGERKEPFNRTDRAIDRAGTTGTWRGAGGRSVCP